MQMLNKAQIIILFIIFILLCIPLIEMEDGNSSINWSVFDFFIAFLLLTISGFSIEFAIRKIKKRTNKIKAILLILLFLLLLWGELAVGIFNSPIAGD